VYYRSIIVFSRYTRCAAVYAPKISPRAARTRNNSNGESAAYKSPSTKRSRKPQQARNKRDDSARGWSFAGGASRLPVSTSSGSMTFAAAESNLLVWKRSIVPRIICHRGPSQPSSCHRGEARSRGGAQGGVRGEGERTTRGTCSGGVKTMYRRAI
jgi:hypothetical protein